MLAGSSGVESLRELTGKAHVMVISRDSLQLSTQQRHGQRVSITHVLLFNTWNESLIPQVTLDYRMLDRR